MLAHQEQILNNKKIDNFVEKIDLEKLKFTKIVRKRSFHLDNEF